MTYSLSLHDRRRYANAKRERYWRDPEYRLARINGYRATAGKPLIASLDEIETRGRRA